MFKRAMDILTPSKNISLVEFESLYLENKDFVRCSIYWMVGSEIANELTQDTFVKAWKNFSRFNKKSSFKTWIYAIAMNTAKDYLRKHKYHIEVDDHIGESLQSDLAQQEVIEIAISQMSTTQREMFILFFKFEYTYTEISKLKGVKEGTVKSRIQKAKKVFTDYLNKIEVLNER